MITTLETDTLAPFGVSASTGRPLAVLSDTAVKAMLAEERESGPDRLALSERADSSTAAFAVIGEVDSSDLGQSGWGVIFAPGIDPAVRQALEPLLEHRRAQAAPFAIYEGADGFHLGEKTAAWLDRQGVRMDVVDPAKGVPYYLLIVAPPDVIPFEFQYSLDIYWAVGRLWFDSADEFRQYADSVIQYETMSAVPPTRNVALFATEHDFDNATQLFTKHVVRPLADGEGATPIPVGKRQEFGLQTYLGEAATKAALANVLRGMDGGAPSLLFSGSHGMQFELGDPRQSAGQGAIVCQDWAGFGDIAEQHWFAGSDLPADAKVHGLMHVLFACHGGGCTELDNFDHLADQPRRIAEKPFFSKLPQKMLSHPNGGALAVLAHIERAWTYSFKGDKGGSQTQGFRDVIGRLLRGERIGQATDVFNTRWAALSTELADRHLDLKHGSDVSLQALGRLWVARDDARNFLILGDPAVRLRVEDIPKPV